ncbi:MAG: DUF58 domain-containing protein [Armatimonadetes bacterium]|nr:DUF58 domain-containing protein [Armatimonadota bacterium]
MVFTRAGLVALMIGPAIALGGLWQPELRLVGLVWVLGITALALIDAILARRLMHLEVKRSYDDPLSLNARNPVTVQLRSRTSLPLDLIVYDDVPEELHAEGNLQPVKIQPYGQATVRYHVRPRQRGRMTLGDVYVRGLALMRLSRWQRRFPVGGEVRVYPSLADLRHYDYLARAQRLQEMGYRRLRRLGAGREFESLREYVPDDDFRDIDWKATARRARPITRQYQVERSQSLMLLLDCGRMMAAETEGMTKLDHAVNAALMLAHVAVEMDDAVGWLAFSDHLLRMRAPRKSREHVARLADELYELQVELVEPDYVAAFAPLKGRLRKRSLVVIFTDIVDLESSERLVSHTAALAPQHLPLLVALRDAELEEIAQQPPAREEDVYAAAVAVRLLDRRAAALAAMRARGALILDVAPHQLTTRVVNQYLAVKAAGRL